ncbi:lysozyme inhibitor LprI family protein [Dyella sp. 20L07]|uniref:lysozyme inhibitor LprI family protein n=1 Tax=Dyella sp. 20L07 TaxID=3384240 RepID=UPI003D2CC520
MGMLKDKKLGAPAATILAALITVTPIFVTKSCSSESKPATSPSTTINAPTTVTVSVPPPLAPSASNDPVSEKIINSLTVEAETRGRQNRELQQSRTEIEHWRQQASNFEFLYYDKVDASMAPVLIDLARVTNFNLTHQQFVQRWTQNLPTEKTEQIINQILVPAGWTTDTGAKISLTPEGERVLKQVQKWPVDGYASATVSVPTNTPDWCTKRPHPHHAEDLVCDEPNLAQQDIELARLYSAWKQQSDQRDAVKAEQLSWLDQRNDCTDINCLRTLYASRIEQLQTYIGSQRR